MKKSRIDPHESDRAADVYAPPMITLIGRVEDLTLGNNGNGGDALRQKSK
jgi:hypothetical protein